MFHKGEHRRCFVYETHTVCDRHNFILDTVVTAGNIHDSVAFDALYEKVIHRFPETETITMDAGYKTSWICKRVINDARIPFLSYKHPMIKKGFHEWYKKENYKQHSQTIERVFVKREIWDEIHTVPWAEKSKYVGKAKICCHEPEKTCNVEVEKLSF